jgi:hypothetical protein
MLPAWAVESTVADRDLPTQTGAHLTAVQNAKTYRIVNALLLIWPHLSAAAAIPRRSAMRR